MLTVRKFIKKIQGHAVYCVIAKTISLDIQDILFFKYSEYVDVFDTEAASVLFEHYPIKHRIDLEPRKNPL